MKSFKKMFSLVVVVSMLAALIAGCGSSAPAGDSAKKPAALTKSRKTANLY